MNEIPADGVKRFYDAGAMWYADSAVRRQWRSGEVAEFGVGIDAPDGGTYGEFRLVWSDFSPHHRWALRIEVFTDGLAALHALGLVELLAAREGEDPSPDEMREILLGLGCVDQTDPVGPYARSETTR